MTGTRIHEKASRAVVRVGDGGRGFVVEGQGDRLIITAAHCLPSFPPCATASYTEERTYASLLAPLGRDPAIWAECFFVDPISDIAVLGTPDRQALYKKSDAYDELVQAAEPLPVADAPELCAAWLLSLDGQWFECKAEWITDGPFWTSEAEQQTEDGMSGSPILDARGAAIGVVCTGSNNEIEGPHARLSRSLPGWMFREIGLQLTPVVEEEEETP